MQLLKNENVVEIKYADKLRVLNRNWLRENQQTGIQLNKLARTQH